MSYDLNIVEEELKNSISVDWDKAKQSGVIDRKGSFFTPQIWYTSTPTAGRSPKPLKFSKEAKDVFEAGKKLWRHYHTQHAGSSQTGSYINVNASYYDIRKCFKGTDANGRMNNKSIDEKYNKLIKDLRDKMDILAKKIELKIYEYGFLRE